MSYQDKPQGQKRPRPIRAIGKGFGKLLGVSKKSKAQKQADEAAFKQRAHFAPKTGAKDNQRDSLDHTQSFQELQNAYYENKEVQEPAKDISQYKSVHRDDYRASSKPRISDFEPVDLPSEKEQEEALAREDYQTRLRVERANQRKKQMAIDPGQVDQSHRQFRRNRANAPSSLNFESNFENGFQDQFQMINADKDYFDQNMPGQTDQDDDDDMFMQQMQALEEGGRHRGRTGAIAGDLEGIVGFGGDFGKPQNDDSLDFDDDGAFGEIGAVDKIQDDNDNDIDEEADVVGELGGGTDIFDKSQKNDLFDNLNSRVRTTSASVINSDLFKGLEEIKKECEDPFNDLDERLKQAALQTDKEFEVGRSSLRRESFVQKTRQALKVRKIQREIELEKNQGIVEEGSMAGLPRLIPLRPRTNMYDQMAKSKIDQFYQNDGQELTEEQQQEIEQQKELNAQISNYRSILENHENCQDELSVDLSIEEKQKAQVPGLQDGNEDPYDNFLDEFYQEMNRDPQRSQENTNLSSQEHKTLPHDSNQINDSTDKYDFTQESSDMIKFIDWNERRHRETALKYLKINSQLHYQGINNEELKQHRLTREQPLRQISEQMIMERQFNNSKATCIALSEDLIIVGNTLGELWMYDRDTEEKYDCFKMDQKNKDFQSNAITVIEIHPSRSEYVLIGYNFGQIVLIDVTDPGKSLKVIKDHHKGSSISNMAFCEWNKQKADGKKKPIEQAQNLNVTINDPSNLQNPYDTRAGSNVYMQNPLTQQKQANLTEWMFISMDSNGKVLVNTIQKVLMILKTNKQTLAEPKRGESKYQSLSTRFKSDLHPQLKINDVVTLAAIANLERVQIYAISQNKSQLIREVLAPTFSRFEKKMTLEGCLPSLSWGFAHSPVFKDKCYGSLVIGWGPLIQMLILNDVMDDNSVFFDDGFVVIQNEKIRQIMEANEKEIGINHAQASPQKQEEEKQFDEVRDRSESTAVMDEINPFLQNQRFEALQQARNNKQAARKTGILMSPFDMPDLFIEKIFFLSESIILVLTRSLEIRIFYTQKLNHGPYNPNFKDNQKKSQSVNPEIDNGQIISNLITSEFGQIYNQTIRSFNGMVIGLGQQGMFRFSHLSWNDSLIQFKKIVQGNWVQELMRAIDIYTGKVKGFRDVPEQEEMRQETMKAELKLLIRNIIIEQLQKWAQQQQEEIEQPPKQEPLDDSNVDILENLEILDDLNKNEKQQKYRTMIRIAIEFCVTIQDCQFLFYDVFLLFQEEQLEQIFLDELKPFIISGRFSDWQMPEDILQNNIINYYKDPDQPEVIEKIITNLNLRECPKSVILELIQFSEKNFLSSALLYLHTAVFDTKDDASCIHCILALLNLYSQAKEDNPGTMDEIRAIRDLSPDSIERVRAEKSHLYLGYKILWVIRMFLNGKKWPSGMIPQARWKNYVHEIVDCISQKNIMLDLLYIDAEAYFQIISICFYKGLVFDFIKSGKQQADKMIKAQVDLVHNPLITSDVWEETMIHLSHNQILERFDNVCQSKVDHDYLVPDSIRLQYLFFVANVASKASISKDAVYYYSCMIELLNKSQMFLNFNKQLLERAFTRKKRWGQQSIKNMVPQNIVDESKHMYISENALMELIELCEPLEDEQTDELIEKTQYTEFYHLRVKLYEKKEDYVQCLQLIIEGMKIKEYSSNEIAIERAFEWIMNILYLLEAKKTEDNPETTHKEDVFRKNIITNFKGLVNLDPQRCVDLIDDMFEGKLQEYVECLADHPEEQLKFVDAILSMHDEKISALIEEYFMLGSQKEKANMYMKFQCNHVKLLCKIRPLKVKQKIREIKNNKVKLEESRLIECLEICQEFQQVEAQAMLMYKMTNYMSSATQYMTLITTKDAFDFPALIKQISNCQKFPHFQPYLAQEEKKRIKAILRLTEQGIKRPTNVQNGIKLTSDDFSQTKIMRFDYIIRKVIKICNKDSTDNYSEETIDKMWFFTLDQIMKIKNEQIKMLQTIKNQKMGSIEELQSQDQANLISGDQQPGQIQKQHSERYETHTRNVEMFFKSRIDSVIENILKYIELDDFLNHIVKKDENLKYEELTNMIHSIFSEKSSECVVLANANRSAKQQIISQFNNASNEYSNGILFRYRQCNICKKFLDEEIISLKKKAELMSHARRGTRIGHAGNLDDDEEDFINNFSVADEDKMRLYDCGHAFHVECIKSYLRDQIVAESQKGSIVQKMAPTPKDIKITKEMLDKQRCPWCYSEKFKIDIEALFSEKQSRKGGNLVQGRKQIGVSTKEEEKEEDIEEDDDRSMDFNDQRIGQFRHGSSVMRRRRDAKFTGSMIQRGKLDIQEQKMAMFDSSVFCEGVTRNNFLIQQ